MFAYLQLIVFFCIKYLIMLLTKEALKAIEKNIRLKSRIIIAAEIHPITLSRWIESNNDNLTKAEFLKIIREETGMNDTDILMENPIIKPRMYAPKK